MVEWRISFLITGFEVDGTLRRGRVVFTPPDSNEPETAALQQSAEFCGFPFAPQRFTRATVIERAVDHRDAARAALHEIDRALDTFVFTDFGRAKYLPVGYAVGATIVPLAFRESYVPMPLRSGLAESRMSSARVREAAGFLKHTEHLLGKSVSTLSDAESALAAGLRWCRLGSAARAFSESVTVAFVLEWLALEAMIVTHPAERVGVALTRIPALMKHWPTSAMMNYKSSLRASDPATSEQEWRKLSTELYDQRKHIFHGREFHVSVDPSAPPSWELGAKRFAILEAVLGRCVAFLGTMSQQGLGLQDAWGRVGAYVPSDDDCPPTNLGGWSTIWR